MKLPKLNFGLFLGLIIVSLIVFGMIHDGRAYNNPHTVYAKRIRRGLENTYLVYDSLGTNCNVDSVTWSVAREGKPFKCYWN